MKQISIPHATRLFTDLLYHFDRVRPFYSFDPFDGQSFFRSAEAIRYPEETRRAVTAVLDEQAAGFGAGERSRRNIERLRRGAFALVTGQQVGIYTGPVFAFYKALTAIRLADSLTERGLDCVPVFWLATEDHDLHEVNHAFAFDGGYKLHRIADETPPPAPNAPVGEVTFGPEIAHRTEEMIALLPDTPWKGELAEALRDTYRPGETYGSSFGRLMARLLERFGVVLLDPLDARLRGMAAELFTRAVDSAAELGAALLDRNKELLRAGYHAQVHVTDNSSLLFQYVDGGRTALRRRNGDFLRGEQRVSRDELLGEVQRRPDDFSANVLLRPLVQDTLLPTVGYVGGPAELAYFAQASALYQRLLGRMPVVYPRASFTLQDNRTRDLLARYGLSTADVFAGPQVLREKMYQHFLPEDLAAAFAQYERKLDELLNDLRERMDGFDHTLADATATSARKMRYQLTKIKRKAGRAAGSRSAHMEQEAELLENFLHPRKNLQERVHSGSSMLGWFGPRLLDLLYERISLQCGDHQVLDAGAALADPV